jgi:hypothetical protein
VPKTPLSRWGSTPAARTASWSAELCAPATFRAQVRAWWIVYTSAHPPSSLAWLLVHIMNVEPVTFPFHTNQQTGVVGQWSGTGRDIYPTTSPRIHCAFPCSREYVHKGEWSAGVSDGV